VGRGSAERRSRWCSFSFVTGGAEDGIVESKRDLTDQEGVLSMASSSSSGAFEFEERARRIVDLVVRLCNDRVAKVDL